MMPEFDPWGPISSLLFENFDSDEVQRIIESAGLAPDWTLTVRDQYSHSMRKRVFKIKISALYQELSPNGKIIFSLNIARGIIRKKPEYQEQLAEHLNHIGWALIEDRIIQIDLLNPNDLRNLPNSTYYDLAKAADRLPSDLSGAITSACGAVESVCKEIYEKYNLGEIEGANFQEKVNKSFQAVNALVRLKNELMEIGWDENSSRILCENLKNSINQAAYVMQKIRSDMGDVHGTKLVLTALAFDSIKWAMIISSLLRNWDDIGGRIPNS